VVRPIGAPIPFQTLLAPVARHSFSHELYRVSILIDPQHTQDEEVGKDSLPIERLGAARSRPQAPHRRRRFVATARLPRVPSLASLAHRGEV
jgi:hypothetical protein